MNFTVIVEHLDEEFFPWCQLEYKRIAENIYPSALMITNFNFQLPESWPEYLRTNTILHTESIAQLPIPREDICLLDSEATTMLSPADAKIFKYYLFGGILGNGKFLH